MLSHRHLSHPNFSSRYKNLLQSTIPNTVRARVWVGQACERLPFKCMWVGHGFARVFFFIDMATPASRDYRTESPGSPTVSKAELQRLEVRPDLQIWSWLIYQRPEKPNEKEREKERGGGVFWATAFLCSVSGKQSSIPSFLNIGTH